jgi:hypothetical protein
LGAHAVQAPICRLGIPCFKLSDTEVYLVVKNILCSFTASEVRPLKSLTVDIQIQSWCGVTTADALSTALVNKKEFIVTR